MPRPLLWRRRKSPGPHGDENVIGTLEAVAFTTLESFGLYLGA